MFFLKGDRSQGIAGSPKETTEEGSENDPGLPSSKKMQGERGGGAALKENVCQVVASNICPNTVTVRMA